jgi:hypothetical protein
MYSDSQDQGPEGRAWWQQRWAVALLMALSAVPLLWPDIPPLVDLPGHMGRYAVQIDLAGSPELQRYYRFEWALIGNLGVDLLVMPLAAILGLELATKLIVVTIPVLTVGGFLWVAREVHGRIPPTALFAVPLAYNYPFSFGFVNFALSMAFAFLAFALWLRLARLGRLKLRAALFVPISLIVWVTHTFGWGTLGVMAFSAELVRQRDLGKGWIEAAFNAGIQVLSLCPPILLMLLWRNSGAVAGETGDWFNWRAKLAWAFMALRDRWLWFDLGSLIVVVVLIGRAIHSKRIGFSRNLAASALFLLLVYLLLPRIVFGSAYADMRLVPYMLAVGIIAIRLKPNTHPAFAPAIAIIAMVFVLARTGATTMSNYLYDQAYDRELQALNHVPRGARLVSFVGSHCRQRWPMSRLEHLPAMALVRRHAFSNDQWSMAGAQLLIADYPAGAGFTRDPSQIVSEVQCRNEIWRSLDASLATLPRAAFDYVWLIAPPPHDVSLTRGLQPVWRSGRSVLYRVVDRKPPVVAAEERP